MCLLCPYRSRAQGDQTKITVNLATGVTTGAWLHLPDDYKTTSTSYPLIIFIHGVGEGGTDVNAVLAHGVPKIIAKGANMQFTVGGKLFKFITVSPQIPNGWASETMIQNVLDDIKSRYRIDDSRIYLTGLSAGGYGVLNYVASGTNYSDNLAAIVPVSTAAIDASKEAGLCDVASSNLAVWSLCGGSDSFIDNQTTYTTKINSCNPKYKAITTTYAGGTHSDNVWDKAYDATHTYQSPNIYEWMLQYSRANAGNTIPAPIAAATASNIILPVSSTILNGSGSSASGSTIASYAWSQVSGPSTATFSSTSAATVTVSKLIAGTYVFSLTVKNAAGTSASTQVSVVVSAAAVIIPAPVAAILNASIAIKLPVSSTTLDGSGSTASGSTIASYTWSQVSGPSTATLSSTSTATITASNLVAGTYVFSLTVKNAAGGTSSTQATVVVSPAATTTQPATGTTACAFCKYLIKPGADGGAYINGATMTVKPGDTVCIQAGNYSYMQFYNFTGTAAKPIVFINCGGQVKIGNGGSYGFIFNNAKYFKVSGAGSSDKYGFSINGVSKRLNVGVAMGKGCTDYEAERMEITGSEVGMMAKVNPDCETANQYPYFAIRNVKLHDLYIHDVSGEGMYIGNTAPNGTEVTCTDGTVKNVLPPRIYGLRIYNVITANTGWDGIQVASAPQDVEIHDNKVSNYGTTNMGSQQAGIILGGESNGKVYNNTVIKGTGNGIEVFGTGLCYVYNNIVSDAGWDGTSVRQDAIFIDDRPTKNNYVPLQVYGFNNTVINSGRDAIRFQNSFGTVAKGNLFYNNLLVTPGSLSSRGTLSYLSFDAGMDYISANNLNYGDVATVKFADAAGKNFHLALGSPVIDKGKDLSAYFKYDIDNEARPQGAGYDVGADEYSSGTVTNVAPVASAGTDITITLPVATVTLDGSNSTDPDGTIASYAWTQVSGPVTATITTVAVAKPVITKLATAGAYVFKLTVTDNKGATATDQVTVTVKAATVVANKAPVASAGSNITITLPTSQTTLNGSATDADGTIASYAWTQLSGPVTSTITSATIAKPTVSKLTTAGTYVFRLIVADDKGAKDTAQVSVIVKAATVVANKPPVASAGTNITITLPTSQATLNGSATDADGTIASYAWTQSSGPVTSTITTATIAKPTVSKLTTAGTYVFRLIVTDDKGAKDTAQVSVIVKAAAVSSNKAPVANAGADVTITQPQNNSDATGAASTDPDGTITSYKWTQVSGPSTASIVKPTAVATDLNQLTTVGTYVFRLTVTDNNGATSTDDKSIIVKPNPANVLVANAGADQTISYPSTNMVTLDGSSSYATGGYVSAYNWVLVSGPAGSNILNPAAQQPVVTFSATGTYVFRLTVTDTYGNTDTDDVTIIVGNKTGVAGVTVSLQVYPNPATTTLHVRLTLAETSRIIINIYTSTGTMRGTYDLGTVSTVSKDIDVSSFSSGIYIMQISDGKTMNLSSKFVKAN
ncbi:Por secretion system C-terminal sorting domain-containing protein [Chitinophaga sp. YR573]|uniref:PKD domain-containing protein n=1 Tax=Chitinophaga sp. YR573 TaxID=1881040 RepID=UPI0008B2F2E6|nr:PKD domain-containing protein [Chitinophaga sp. YR573]SEW40633.1 Por secretion system C-terminal sorting domain-containing protein [Chitinophaga sp. YR573]